MKAQKRFLIVLVAIALVLSFVFTGFGWPGFMLGLIPKDSKAEGGITAEALRRAAGNSRAFSKELADGITVSAAENALDRDRDFRLSPVSDADLCSAEEKLNSVSDECIFLYDIWDLSCGLSEDETLPGTYEVSFDLEKLGIDRSVYEKLAVYRISDSGQYYKLNSRIDGDTLTAKSNQNSALAIGAAAVGLAIASPFIHDFIEARYSSAYFVPALRSSIKEYKVPVDGDDQKFIIRLNVKSVNDLMFENDDEAWDNARKRACSDAAKEFIKSTQLMDEQLRAKCLALVPEKINPKNIASALGNILVPFLEAKGDTENIRMKKMIKSYILGRMEELTQEEIKNEDAYRKHEEVAKSLLNEKQTLDEISKIFRIVEKTAKYLNKAYFFLKDVEKVSLPAYPMYVEITDDAVERDEDGNKAKGTFGVTTKPWLSNPYMVIYANVITGESDSQYDELLLTIVHELFHAVQRLYVSGVLANYTFDEVTAQVVEWEAFEYFKTDGTILKPNDSNHLKNAKQCHLFAVPLNGSSVTWPEGGIGIGYVDDGNKIDTAMLAYSRAPFVKYLKAETGKTWPQIMTTYKAMSGLNYFSTVMKTVFNTGKGSEMSEADYNSWYMKYAVKDYQRFMDRAEVSRSNSVFSPIAYVGKEKAETKFPNRNYTIRVRRVRLIANRSGKKNEFALVIKYNDNYKTVMSDFRLIPLDMKKEEEYKEWDSGLFILPTEYPEKNNEDAVYLMEADGGLSSSEGFIWDTESGYTIYHLYALPEPEMETKDGVLKIKSIKRAEYRSDVIDRVVATISLGDTVLHYEDKKYGFGGEIKDWKIDLSELEIDGKPLTAKQKKELKITFEECVSGTWDPKDLSKACLGPCEIFDVPADFDITGTYAVTATISDITLGETTYQLVGGAASLIAGMFGADPSDQEIRDAINGSVEINKDPVTLSQTVKISRIKDNKYKIDMESNEAFFSYEGTLDDDNILTMQLKNYVPGKTGDSDGIDATSDFFYNISLTFLKDSIGEAYIDGSCDVKSAYLNGVYTCKGRKVPGE